jgi:hypothetical protein
MANTFIKIAAVEAGSGGSSSFDFTVIPGTYTDLCIKVSARTNRSLEVDGLLIRFNNDNTSGNYSGRRMYGAGSGTPGSDTTYSGMPFNTAANATASTFGNIDLYVPNYAGSTAKSFSIDGVGENNATTTYAGLGAGLWSGTAAITRVTLYPETGTLFNQYSTATLYGISKS